MFGQASLPLLELFPLADFVAVVRIVPGNLAPPEGYRSGVVGCSVNVDGEVSAGVFVAVIGVGVFGDRADNAAYSYCAAGLRADAVRSKPALRSCNFVDGVLMVMLLQLPFQPLPMPEAIAPPVAVIVPPSTTIFPQLSS